MRRVGALVLAVLGLWSCPSARPKVQADNLYQHWVRSHEEEEPAGTVEVFRPASSKEFPPSRFRMAYKFSQNGDCEYHVLSPDDAHRFDACTWRVVEGDHARLEIAAIETRTSFKIVELSEGLLRLEPIE